MKNKGVEILAKALDFLPLLGKLFISINILFLFHFE